jgi:Domain of unknown function (DUF4157)
LGSNIYLGRSASSPDSPSGRHLLAHELAHVFQQRDASYQLHAGIGAPDSPAEREAEAAAQEVSVTPPGRLRPLVNMPRHLLTRPLVQRQTVAMASGRQVGNSGAAVDNLREEVILALDRLHFLWSISNPDYNTEYPLVKAKPAGSNLTIADIPKTIAAITNNEVPVMNKPVALFALGLSISGDVGVGRANNKMDILGLEDSLLAAKLLTDAAYKAERKAVKARPAGAIPDAIIVHTIAAIALVKKAIVAGDFVPHVLRKEVLRGTRAVTPLQHAAVEAALTPGAAVVAPPPPAVGLPPPAPVVVPPPLMAGLPPAPGMPGAFEIAMKVALTTSITASGGAFRALKAGPGQPAIPIPTVNAMAGVAQQEVEAHFRPYIQVASHGGTDVYHPDVYQLSTDIGDQSTVVITDNGTATQPGRKGWVGYWMKQAAIGLPVMTIFHCDPTRAPDDAEFERVRDSFAIDPAKRADIDDTIHSYPAETSAKVFVQPNVAVATPLEKRQKRWDLFTVLIHEMMHRVEHPNYRKARDTIGGDAQEILKEGMADVMRRDIWDPPGNLRARLGTGALAPMRAIVEGVAVPYAPAAIQYHQDYTDKYPKAKAIVFGGGGRPGVGIENAKVAFFMGHVELLGVGAGTATAGGAPLAGVGMYSATEAADAELVVAVAGDTEATIRALAGAAAKGVRNATSGVVLPAGAPIVAGTKLRVKGIRWTYALADDTLGSIANQHALPLQALAKANRLPPLTPETFRFALGTRVLIPIHNPRP